MEAGKRAWPPLQAVDESSQTFLGLRLYARNLLSTKRHFLHILLLYFYDQSCLALAVTTSSGLKPVLHHVSAGGISPKGEQKDAIRRLHWQRSFSVAAYWIQQEQALLSVFDYKLGSIEVIFVF